MRPSSRVDRAPTGARDGIGIGTERRLQATVDDRRRGLENETKDHGRCERGVVHRDRMCFDRRLDHRFNDRDRVVFPVLDTGQSLMLHQQQKSEQGRVIVEETVDLGDHRFQLVAECLVLRLKHGDAPAEILVIDDKQVRDEFVLGDIMAVKRTFGDASSPRQIGNTGLGDALLHEQGERRFMKLLLCCRRIPQ